MTDPRPGDAFQAGDILNNTYRIEALLGRGGTSEVYRARSEISGRQVAVKVLKAEFSANDDYLVLLTREENIREVRHDAIVRYSENHRTSDGLIYLLMDYIEGPGLDRKLKAGPMSAADLLIVAKRVAEGLQAAHARNIVHRDLSPDNIILRNGDPAQAVVIDFGIAKDTNPGAQTIVGNEFAGKYAYAAPEQLSGQSDKRTDIYSLGALLLANFRGKAPNAGANPMEVVENKSKPLDTSGVPEPLKTLVDKMTAPALEARLQSMEEVLALIEKGAAPDDMDATIIAPPPKPAPQGAVEPPPRSNAAPPAPKKPVKPNGVSGGVIVALLALVLIGGGVAAYFGGLIGGGPTYPAVTPYTLVVENLENKTPSARGYVPVEEMQNALVTRMNDIGGSVDVTLASGEIAEDWSNEVLSVIDTIASLDTWSLSMQGNQGEITGSTTDPDLHALLTEEFAQDWAGSLDGFITIVLTSVFLDSAEVEEVLTSLADCGPLVQVGDVGPTGYGPDTPIEIAGTVASDETRTLLSEALNDLAGQRPVHIETNILNPTLCLVENYLPKAGSGGIDIVFRDGASGATMGSGRFLVGQNPVIDIVLPADVTDGYLSVSVLDVSGNVFHLLPNIGRADNSIASLRGGREGEVDLRVAYALEENRPDGAIAFAVDDSSLGKSKIIAIHSDGPLFPEMRPTTESAVGYAEALSEQAQAQGILIRSLDARILTTAAP